jgi:ankyrin repeat protein
LISTADFSSAIHLRYTVTSGFIEMIQVLLNLGANINELNNYDQSVLHHIGLFGSAEVAEFLLKYPKNRSFFINDYQVVSI